MLTTLRTHPVRWAAGTAVAVAALAWLAFGFFGVHTLFVDDVVDDAAPVFDVVTELPATEPAVVVTAVPDAPAPGSTAEAPADTDTDTSEDDAATEPAAEPEATQVVAEAVGTFVGDAHPTSGTATVLGNGTGQRFLRFEEFATDNGPDLNVYLVDSSTGDVSDYVDLGDLRGNIGDQNYEIPADVDLDRYDTVVIWCVRFGVAFGSAPLTTA